MPVILPQLPDSMFSTYDPRYVPGYTGYTSKLRSDKGNIYGNATLQAQDYEPGQQRPSAWRENYRLSSDLHLGGIISNIPKENAEIWNNKNGYYHPASGKYHLIRMNHTLDGDPKTSSAITAIEEIKYELTKPDKWMSSETERCASSQNVVTPKQTSKCIREADQRAKFSYSPTYRMEMTTKTLRNDFTEKEHSSSMLSKNNLFQNRQGKIIYRSNSGLLPNYSGYTPGQMFLIGNTWGRSTVNALGKLQDQRFQWTSLF